MPDLRVDHRSAGSTLVVHPFGRLDPHGCAILRQVVDPIFAAPLRNLVLDLKDVPYLSSASLRVFLQYQGRAAAQGGRLALASIQPYCQEVIRISGLDGAISIFPAAEDAITEFEPATRRIEADCGAFDFGGGADAAGAIEVLGHIDDVLASRVTAAHLKSKTFSSKGYSLGLGAMGATDAEVLPLLGEMMTIEGTMVWLPTDGNDTPDFLSPKTDSALVRIRTAFNASLAGPFNEFVHFESKDAGGATMTEIYRALFDLAKGRRADHRGAIGLAMRAEVSEVFGSGVLRSPIVANAPANGGRIIDPENFAEWFEFDAEARHRNVTGLISGVGVDLDADLSAFDQRWLDATFYRNPANRPAMDCLLHNHGTFFSPLPFSDSSLDLEAEIAAVVDAGDFVDMRHLLDRTAITRALIGLIYVQEFRSDSENG